MRKLVALVFCYFLTACAGSTGLPAMQTLGLEPDADAQKKQVLAMMGLTVDAVGVYGKLCAPVQTKACNSPKHYQNAKLIAQSVSLDAKLVAEGRRSPVAALAIFALTQYALVKTVADQPGPTDPSAPPRPDAIAYIDAIDAADLLVTSADERVRDASGPNVSVADLLADLQARVAALP